jgi:RNA-directed DNA polymerase
MANGITLARVARLLEIDRVRLIALASRAQGMYHTQVIPIGSKRRVLDIPRLELKVAQRALHDRVFSTIQLSPCVYGVRGAGVVENAKRHLNQPYLAILDIAECFPSTTVRMVRQGLLRAGFDESAVKYLLPLVTLRGRLPQGPPSSPSVMNIVLRALDEELNLLASSASVTYTRYMDDLCFSGATDLGHFATRCKAVLRRHGFATNALKNRVWGPDDPHTVTKIVVTTELNPSPEYVQALTHELLRLDLGTNLLTATQVRGQIAWVGKLNPRIGAKLLNRWTTVLAANSSRIANLSLKEA